MGKVLRIIGSRGIPARYGGFETFAQHLSIYLNDKNWKVEVYCQKKGFGSIKEKNWNGINLFYVPSLFTGTWGSIIFDIRTVLHTLLHRDPVLMLGYNMAILSLFYKLFNIPIIINVDGLEWKRDKWNLAQKSWLYLNEKAAVLFADHIIADHPEIGKRFNNLITKNKLSNHYYCSPLIDKIDDKLLKKYNIKKNKYCLLACRMEPENSVLDIIKAYSSKRRNYPLIVVGKLDNSNEYHKSILKSASSEVKFIGYVELNELNFLRKGAMFYLHGHTVGGTNPSLVEALAAGSAIIAHDNKFNKWVADKAALYFSNVSECDNKITELIKDTQLNKKLRKYSLNRFNSLFTFDKILPPYEKLLSRFTKQ